MTGYARVDLEPAYILHMRPYRETSQILEVITRDHGRKGIVARGARRPKGPWRGMLELFQPLRLSWSGRGDLVTLRAAEQGGLAAPLQGDAVMAGFYANELLLKLLHRDDPHADLFAHYATLIAALAGQGSIEFRLRQFELELLEHLGYGLDLLNDALSREPLDKARQYVFHPDQGAIPAGDDARNHELAFTGAELLAIAQLAESDAAALRNAKRLLRCVLDHHLGHRPLQTRRIAAAMQR